MKFKLSESNISQMSVEAVVEECHEIRAALERPRVDGWYGFAGNFQNKIDDRLTRLKSRLAEEYLKK